MKRSTNSVTVKINRLNNPIGGDYDVSICTFMSSETWYGKKWLALRARKDYCRERREQFGHGINKERKHFAHQIWKIRRSWRRKGLQNQMSTPLFSKLQENSNDKTSNHGGGHGIGKRRAAEVNNREKLKSFNNSEIKAWSTLAVVEYASSNEVKLQNVNDDWRHVVHIGAWVVQKMFSKEMCTKLKSIHICWYKPNITASAGKPLVAKVTSRSCK